VTKPRVPSIVRKAIEEPLRGSPRTPATRATSSTTKVAEPLGHGLDAATGEYEDLVKAGVIDPTKVTPSALRNAAS
jgi:chaperonin GroEL